MRIPDWMSEVFIVISIPLFIALAALLAAGFEAIR